MTGSEAQDRISLRGVAGHGYHGIFDHERRDGQRFVVDVELALPLERAARDGDLAATVDYGVLAERVHGLITGDPFDLIETLALRIVSVCLEFEAVSWVSVTVHKPEAPIAVAFSDVAVTIERSRQ